MGTYLTHRPARGNITHPFGAGAATATSPSKHLGLDFGWGGGDEVFAARSGKVTSYSRAGAYGNRIIVDHGDGHETWYCHLDSALVRVGDTVTGGQQIGWMGATGNVTAKHLHFEVRINGNPVNPEAHLPTGNSTAGLEVTDMPLDNADIIKLFEGGIDTTNLGSGNARTMGQALSAIYFYGNLANKRQDELLAAVNETIRISNANWKILSDQPSTAFDVDKMAAVLAKAGLAVTADALAKALDVSLRDNFAAIPAAVVAGIKTAL